VLYVLCLSVCLFLFTYYGPCLPEINTMMTIARSSRDSQLMSSVQPGRLPEQMCLDEATKCVQIDSADVTSSGRSAGR